MEVNVFTMSKSFHKQRIKKKEKLINSSTSGVSSISVGVVLFKGNYDLNLLETASSLSDNYSHCLQASLPSPAILSLFFLIFPFQRLGNGHLTLFALQSRKSHRKIKYCNTVARFHSKKRQILRNSTSEREDTLIAVSYVDLEPISLSKRNGTWKSSKHEEKHPKEVNRKTASRS